MKNKLKGLAAGILIGMTIVSSGALATTGVIQKVLEYNNIKITLDNKEIVPKDANGQYVEPFTIEGTTYLPVRAISNALGLGVEWDDSTKTVKLSTQKTAPSSANKIIYDENGIKITYLGIAYGNYDTSYLQFKLLIENNSSQKISLYSDDSSTSINGFMIDGLMVADVYPGKKIYDEFKFSKSALEKNSISTLNDVELGFYYNFNNKYVYTGALSIIGETNNGNSTASSNVNKGFGQVKGQFTYQYNNYVGTRGDNGAKILLIPKNNDVKSFDNKTAALGVSGEYESGILVKKCDGYGNFDFGDSVPAGEYVCIVISKIQPRVQDLIMKLHGKTILKID